MSDYSSYYAGRRMRHVQVNNRVVVIRQWDHILVVLDAETLQEIQLIDPTPTSGTREEIDQELSNSEYDIYCCLSEDLLHDIVIFKNRNLAIIRTHQFNKSSGHFETIQEREIEFTLWPHRFNEFKKFRMYVDDRYCIFDWEYFTSK